MASLDRYKLSSTTWDSDKEPHKFTEFMFLMSSMVRAIQHGPVLEDFLDRKLNRRRHQAMSTPSYLTEDPDFTRPPVLRPEAADDELSDHEGSVGNGSAVGTQATQSGLYEAGINYFDMNADSLQLDAMLYNVLRMYVKGGKSILLDCVQFPSYVQVMCVLYKHCDMSKNDRITRAFDKLDKLTYNGDVQVWQAEAMSGVRELFESGASITHFAL